MVTWPLAVSRMVILLPVRVILIDPCGKSLRLD
jgi:hypothetical protein